jgi:hypothetical protein
LPTRFPSALTPLAPPTRNCKLYADANRPKRQVPRSALTRRLSSSLQFRSQATIWVRRYRDSGSSSSSTGRVVSGAPESVALRICRILSAVAGPMPGTCCSSSDVAELRLTGFRGGFFVVAEAPAANNRAAKTQPLRLTRRKERIETRGWLIARIYGTVCINMSIIGCGSGG